MKCSKCGYDNDAGVNYCAKCNNALGAVPIPPVTPASSVQPPVSPANSPAPARPGPSGPSGPYPQPYFYPPPFVSREKQPFTITDAYIIIGFVLAVVGIFVYAFLLLPISIGFSVVGFVKRTNSRTHGLSIAGIVVGVVACLMKVGMVLHELGLIPDWLSAGIF